MQVFLSFSGAKREEYAIHFLNYFSKVGLKCWYDHEELFIGDQLYATIISEGINKSNYGIILIDKSFLERHWPMEEAELLIRKLEYNALFPLLLNVTKDEVAKSKIKKILEYKYQFIFKKEDIEHVCDQILNRILHDVVLSECTIKSIEEAIRFFDTSHAFRCIDYRNALHMINSFDTTQYTNKTIAIICLLNTFTEIEYSGVLRYISYKVFEKQVIGFDLYKAAESIFLINLQRKLSISDCNYSTLD